MVDRISCDILYVCGSFNYGKSVSGSYILYKILKQCDVNIKVLPLFEKSSHPVDYNDFLPSNGFEIDKLPNHKILLVSGDDLKPNVLKEICTKYNSILLNTTMTHWMYGNTSPYPELDDDFDGEKVIERLNLYNSVKSYIITASTHSTNVHKMSKFSHIPFVQIPFPLEEIDNDEAFKKQSRDKKIILWGTTQPNTPRKGKSYFENILKWLYNLMDNPTDILIQTIGEKSLIDTQFDVEYLGRIPTRFELSKIYKNADVFALTTLADAGPMMATECIRNETPLVSFSTNIASDYVDNGKNGYIVDCTEDYAKKLYEILFNKNFHIDLDYVKKINSQEVVILKYNEFFKKLLNE